MTVFYSELEGVRFWQAIKDASEDPRRAERSRLFKIGAFGSAAMGCIAVQRGVLAVQALALGLFGQFLWFSLSFLAAYEIGRVCWNLQKIAWNRGVFYTLFPQVLMYTRERSEAVHKADMKRRVLESTLISFVTSS